MYFTKEMNNIDPVLSNKIVPLMSSFSMTSDKLEIANHHTLENVVPSYYRMMNDVQTSTDDHKVTQVYISNNRPCRIQ